MRKLPTDPHYARPLRGIQRGKLRDVHRKPDGQCTNKRPDEKPEHYPAHLTDPIETPSPAAPPSEAPMTKVQQVSFHRRLPHVCGHRP